MAPKDNLVKGQRPISSFFFKKPEAKPGSSHKHELATPAEPQPPSKRRKKAETQTNARDTRHRANGEAAGLTDAQIGQPHELELVDLTQAPDERSGDRPVAQTQTCFHACGGTLLCYKVWSSCTYMSLTTDCCDCEGMMKWPVN